MASWQGPTRSPGVRAAGASRPSLAYRPRGTVLEIGEPPPQACGPERLRKRLHEHFADKEDAFLVAYEVGHGKGRAIVERVHDAAPDWPQAVRAGIMALLEFLASEPAFTHLALVDALIATPAPPSAPTRASSGTPNYSPPASMKRPTRASRPR